MCVVSNVGDYWRDTTLPNKWPNYPEVIREGPSSEEFQDLKKDVEELKKLLLAAKEYDKNVGEPHCESEDKVILIKTIAKALGVDLKGIFE